MLAATIYGYRASFERFYLGIAPNGAVLIGSTSGRVRRYACLHSAHEEERRSDHEYCVDRHNRWPPRPFRLFNKRCRGHDLLRRNELSTVQYPLQLHLVAVGAHTVRRRFPSHELPSPRRGDVRKTLCGAANRPHARPHEVAMLALFLYLNDASFITGMDYPIEGAFFNLQD
jgi:hypothetical protein